MSKHFKTFPPAAEQYNPAAIKESDLLFSHTFDEAGRRHSVDGNPATFAEHGGDKRLSWFNHGVLSGGNDKPSIINFQDNFYETYNEALQPQSYDGKPSGITSSVQEQIYTLEWRNKGLLHRGNDEPARIIYEVGTIVKEIYVLHGIKHRSGGKAAMVSSDEKIWYVQGQLHNPNGLAHKNMKSDLPYDNKYGLYGVELPPAAFKRIKKLEQDKKIPLWVAFLAELNLIENEQLEILNVEETIWDYSISLLWQLHTLGINSENFFIAVEEKAKKHKFFTFHSRSSRRAGKLEGFIDIVQFERAHLDQPTINNQGREKTFNEVF
jgi:hypothetical protein